MVVEQRATTFGCRGAQLFSILTVPEKPHSRGVVVVVGGPQYRIGSHRQFYLLASHLAAAGIPVMRFDYRGMGDSEGEMRSFEDVGEDIREAVGHFCDELPQIREVVLLGLCDGAAASAIHARADARVTGLILLNPWVRTDAGQARAYLKHYYLGRLFERSFWRKVIEGKVDCRATIRSLLQQWRVAGSRQRVPNRPVPVPPVGVVEKAAMPQLKELPQRVFDGLAQFNGQVLVALSGHDLTAREFEDLAGSSRAWKRLMAQPRIARIALPDADHTFSDSVIRGHLFGKLAGWLRSW